MEANILGPYFSYTKYGTIRELKSGARIGYLHYRLYREDGEYFVYIEQLRIYPKYMGRHFGSRVMKWFCKWLDRQNYNCQLFACNNFDQDISINDYALFKFYKKFGFKSKGNKSSQDMFRIIKKESP